MGKSNLSQLLSLLYGSERPFEFFCVVVAFIIKDLKLVLNAEYFISVCHMKENTLALYSLTSQMATSELLSQVAVLNALLILFFPIINASRILIEEINTLTFPCKYIDILKENVYKKDNKKKTKQDIKTSKEGETEDE